MFTVKIGAITLDVECALIEQMAEDVAAITEALHLPPGAPRIIFHIGPITEQESSHVADPHGHAASGTVHRD